MLHSNSKYCKEPLDPLMDLLIEYQEQTLASGMPTIDDKMMTPVGVAAEFTALFGVHEAHVEPPPPVVASPIPLPDVESPPPPAASTSFSSISRSAPVLPCNSTSSGTQWKRKFSFAN
eukprot:9025604-Karenia_brevis.AAC.1